MMRYLAPTPRDGLTPVPVPDFSVVIPAYQAATVVGAAIESVLAQTVEACEIIVCNDGSTDHLYDALAPFMPRIRVIDKENGGEASAKNAGIRAATGEFVAILDADDVFLPGRLERLGELASLRPDLDLLTTDSYLVVNGVRVRNCYTADFRFPSSGQRAAILRYNFLPFAAARRAALIAMDGFDETLRNVPDWDLWLRMILAGARAGLVDEPLAEYRLGSTNVTSDRARVHRGKLETLEKAKRTFDLTQEDRAIVEAGIEDERRALALWDARDALRVRGPAARRGCLRLLHTEGIGIRAKLNAAAGILAPRTASRVLERRDRAGVETTAGVRVNAQTITMGPSTQLCSRPCSEIGSDGVLASVSSTRELDGASLVLHRVSVQRPRALRELLLSDDQVFELTPPVGAPFPCFVVLDDHGSDRGRSAAAGEVAAVRARRGEVPISWGPSVSFSGASELLQWQFARGRCSIDEMRRDPSLVSGLQIGRWFGARWQIRVLRTAVTALPAPTACALARVAAMVPTANFGRVAADLAFWAGVRAAATDSEWSALARDSYVALCYHRITDDPGPGQERMSLPPSAFRRQVGLLRWLRYQALSPDDVVAFHDGIAPIGRRRYALTADDGFTDCVAETIAAGAQAHLFVPTAAPGQRAWWTEGGEVAEWPQLLAAAEAGAAIGSHGRSHCSLVDLDDEHLRAELEGSRAELTSHVAVTRALLAYPNGRYDERVRSMTIDAGYEAAYTTDPGRNGRATDPWSLRRVTPKSWDSHLSFLYRVFTGEPIPARWDARRQHAAARSNERRSIASARRRRIELKADRIVRTASPGRRFRTALVDEVLERQFSDSTRVKLLDAGSEDGVLATQIAQRRPTWLIVGIDLNLVALRNGRQWAAGNGVRNISFVQADITALVRENAFDAAIAIDSLAEVPDDEGALRAIASSLRPGGLFIAHTPVAGWEPVLAGSARYWPRAVRRGHEPAELVAKIEAVGLVVDEVRPTFRSLGHLAQEIRDRWLKPRRLLVRLAAYPFLLGAVRLERAGFSWGAHRELFVVAHRPHDARNDEERGEERDNADPG